MRCDFCRSETEWWEVGGDESDPQWVPWCWQCADWGARWARWRPMTVAEAGALYDRAYNQTLNSTAGAARGSRQ